MMSITITLTPDQEQKLAELARQSGKDPSVYVHDVVTAYLNGAGPKGVKTFEEIGIRGSSPSSRHALRPRASRAIRRAWPQSSDVQHLASKYQQTWQAAMAMGLGEFPDMANVDRDDLPR